MSENEEKNIAEIEADLKNKPDPGAKQEKKPEDPEKMKMRGAILAAIKKDELEHKEEAAAREADDHTFEKKGKFREARHDFQDKLDEVYQGFFSNIKNFRSKLANLKKDDKIKDKETIEIEEKNDKPETETKKIKEDKPEQKKVKVNKKINFRQSFTFFGLNLVITLVLLFGLTVTLIGFGIYQNAFFSPATQSEIVNLIPYPAGIVNNHFLSIAELREDVAALNRFYAVQIESGIFGEIPEGTVIQDIVWERFVQNSLIKDLATEYNSEVSKERIDQELETITVESGGEENLDKQIAFLYGWSVDKFMEKIIKPYLLREEIAATVFKDGTLRDQKKQFTQDLLAKIQADPDNFEEYAKQFSEDEVSKQVGGDLGYFVEGVVAEEIESELRKMDSGEISDILETGEGYEILKLEDKIIGDDGRLRFKARRILVRYPTFEELLSKRRQEAKIYRFIN